MKWAKVTAYAIRSECGRWQISRANHANGSTYTLWDMTAEKDPDGVHRPVASFQDPDAAKAAALRYTEAAKAPGLQALEGLKALVGEDESRRSAGGGE